MNLSFSGIASFDKRAMANTMKYLPKRLHQTWFYRFRINKQILLTMKMITGLLLIAALHVGAKGWTQKLSISEKNIPLKKLFAKISKQTGVSIMYDNALIKNAKPVTINVTDASIEEILDICLANQNFTYSTVNNAIVVQPVRVLKKPELPINTAIVNAPITGTVVDEKSTPLEGVSVSVKGTSNGTSTNGSGQFTIDANIGDSIQFSMVGFNTYATKVTKTQGLRIVLQSAVSNMDQVVVIGYGSKKRATVTGAVSSINATQLNDRPAANTTDLLQGLAPGFNVARGNSGRVADQQTSINIRGPISRADPGVLVVVDGIPQVDNNAAALDNINPNDIESIDILKDAQAAIYGARAAGGVILVTTKKGKSEKPTISVGANLTLQKPALGKKSVNIIQLVEMMNEAFTNDGQAVNKYTPAYNYIKDNNITFDGIKNNNEQHHVAFDNSFGYYLGHYDWVDILFDPSVMQNYNVSVSGRSEKSNYFTSIGIVNQPSILSNGVNNNKKYFARLKYEYDLAKWLKVNVNFSLENQKIKEPSDYGGIEFWTGLIWPVYSPYNSKGHYYNWGSHVNPLGIAKEGGTRGSDAYRIKAQVGGVITPFKNFSINTDFSAAYDINETEYAFIGFDHYDEYDHYSYNSNGGFNSAGANYARSKYYVANLYANYHIGVGDHAVDLMAGTSHEEFDYRFMNTYRYQGLINGQLPTYGVGAANQQFNDEQKNQSAINSFFSRINYSFKNKYLLEGTFRYDGSSKFAKGFQWKPFYGISAGWVISNEDFMANTKSLLSNLKLRASWGQVGNQASIGYFDYISQINIGGSYPMGSSLSPTQTLGAYLYNLPSNDRTWETVETKNIGLDFGLLNNRLGGTVDYYVRDDANMFYTKDFPQVLGTYVPEFGFTGTLAPSINGAHVRTKGIEFTLGWKDKVGDFTYSASVNYSNSTNKIIKLADSRIPVRGVNAFVEGYPVSSFFGYEYDGIISTQKELDDYTTAITSGVPQDLKLGDARYRDLDGDGKLVLQQYDPSVSGPSGDLKYLGDATQHHLFGINLGAGYKNFDLSIFLQGVLGWNVMESNRAFIYDSWPALSYFYNNTWAPTRTDATYPRLSANYGIRDNNYRNSDAPYMFINNKYIRLKNLQLGYNFPKSIVDKLNFKNIRAFVTGFDIFELDNLPGKKNYDPEKPFNPYITPMMRRYSFGVNVTF